MLKLPMLKNLYFATKLPSEISQNFVHKIALQTYEYINWKPEGAISIAFISKQKSQEINKKYAGNDYPTDVLSFNYDIEYAKKDINVTNEFSGEILICSSIARTQAKQYKTDLKSEIALLVVHGLMHLSGRDHQNDKQKTSFEAMQSGILKSLKLKYHSMPW